jgi:hypothetical protein
MEYIYPAFERGRIMKKELLEALRDYAYSGWQLRYQDYPDGILEGCALTTADHHILIAPGIIKCGGFIFLLKHQEQAPYEATERYISLKFRVEQAERFTDYNRYLTAFVLDEVLDRKENEVELCRFKLKAGSRLRYEYRDFYDIQTEFDTINLADATWAGRGGAAIAKPITDYFAREVLKCEKAQGQDIQFAYMCLQSSEAVPSEILIHYMRMKLRGQGLILADHHAFFPKLTEILEHIRTGKESVMGSTGRARKTIIMD